MLRNIYNDESDKSQYNYDSLIKEDNNKKVFHLRYNEDIKVLDENNNIEIQGFIEHIIRVKIVPRSIHPSQFESE